MPHQEGAKIGDAAAYIQQIGARYSLWQYIRAFQKNEKYQLNLLKYEAGYLRRDEEAKSSIITIWQISFDDIRKKWPLSADLLSLMSIFDSSILSDDVEWNEIIEGNGVYRRTSHNGIWALRGHRIRGLNVLLLKSFTDKGALVTLKRDNGKSQLVWEVRFDDLVSLFRNNQHKTLNEPFVDRRNFQATFGLGMTNEKLEEGDNILKAMYDSVDF